MVQRGGVPFGVKAANCQAAGASAVIFVNTDEELFVVAADSAADDPAERSVARLPMVLIRASDGGPLLGGGGGNFVVDLSFTRWAAGDDEDCSSDESYEEDSDDGGLLGESGPCEVRQSF